MTQNWGDDPLQRWIHILETGKTTNMAYCLGCIPTKQRLRVTTIRLIWAPGTCPHLLVTFQELHCWGQSQMVPSYWVTGATATTANNHVHGCLFFIKEECMPRVINETICRIIAILVHAGWQDGWQELRVENTALTMWCV